MNATTLPDPDAEIRTYHDRPVLKEPVWKARYILPTYFSGRLAAGMSLPRSGTRPTRAAVRIRGGAAASAGGLGLLLAPPHRGEPSPADGAG